MYFCLLFVCALARCSANYTLLCVCIPLRMFHCIIRPAMLFISGAVCLILLVGMDLKNHAYNKVIMDLVASSSGRDALVLRLCNDGFQEITSR